MVRCNDIVNGKRLAECLASPRCLIFGAVAVFNMANTVCLWYVRVCEELCASGCVGSFVFVQFRQPELDKAVGAQMPGLLRNVFLKSFCNTGLNRHLCSACMCAHAHAASSLT